MQIYLVKWPDASVSLVSAWGEHDLFMTIDQRADPYCVSWQEYNAPIWIDFAAPEDALPEEGDVDPANHSFDAVTPWGEWTDHQQEMIDAIRTAGTPTVETLREDHLAEAGSIPRDVFETACRADKIVRLEERFWKPLGEYFGAPRRATAPITLRVPKTRTTETGHPIKSSD